MVSSNKVFVMERFIREQVRRFLGTPLREDSPDRSRGLRGGTKKELRDLKALADVNPGQLMTRLGLSGFSANKNSKPKDIIEKLVSSAIEGAEEMSSAYSGPRETKDSYGREGILVDVSAKDLSTRDGALFLRHTIRGARRAGLIYFGDRVYVELFGDSILIYPGTSPRSWNMPLSKKKKSEPKPQAKPRAASKKTADSQKKVNK